MSYNEAMDKIQKVKDLTRLVESMGWFFARQNGSHMMYKKDNAPTLCIPAGNGNKSLIARGTKRDILKLVYNQPLTI